MRYREVGQQRLTLFVFVFQVCECSADLWTVGGAIVRLTTRKGGSEEVNFVSSWLPFVN